jgi:hypothetical protein
MEDSSCGDACPASAPAKLRAATLSECGGGDAEAGREEVAAAGPQASWTGAGTIAAPSPAAAAWWYRCTCDDTDGGAPPPPSREPCESCEPVAAEEGGDITADRTLLALASTAVTTAAASAMARISALRGAIFTMPMPDLRSSSLR